MSKMKLAGAFMLLASLPSAARAQSVAGQQHSANIQITGHLVGRFEDIDLDQELSRPYVYMSNGRRMGFDIVSVKNPSKPTVIYSWGLDNPELHVGGAMSAMYLKSHGRYYLTESYQFRDGQGPDQDLAMIVFDITGLPDTSKIKELKRIRVPEGLGGMHESFGYKHSNGRALLFASSYTPYAYIYDIDDVVNGVG